jgi:hypothetical protein
MEIETRVIPRGSSSNREDLSEYFELRSKVFTAERRHEDFPTTGDSFEEFSSYVLVTQAESPCQVVGGVRLILREPGCLTPLKIETAGFSLASVFPKIDFFSLRCAQVSGMIVEPSFRAGGLGMIVGTRMMEALLQYAKAEEVDILVGNPVLGNAHRMQRLANSRGVNLRMYPEIEFPAKALARERGYSNVLILASFKSEEELPLSL